MTLADEPTLGKHGERCECELCKRFHNGDDITAVSQQDHVRDWIEKTKKEIPIKKNDNETGYTSDSIYSKHQKRIENLVNAHWAYQEKLLSVGQNKSQTFTWDQVMEMRKWDYCSSGKHFYGHGYEDAIEYLE